ncbi:hypothetical protein D3C72_2497710 [compost metagenome]
MCRKFSAYDRSLRGYIMGWPMEYLYTIAARVGILATRRTAEISRCCGLLMSSESW